MMSGLDDIEDQASVWLARQDRGLSEAERAAFDAWLAADTAHQVCYLRLKALWHKVDRLAGQDLVAVPPARPAIMWRALAATVLIGVISAGVWQLYGSNPAVVVSHASYATRLGQNNSVQLTDGTKVQLNTDTHLTQTMTTTAREIRLDHGEAFFDVAKDAKRPFVVYAGNRKITDIGTKFSVRRDGDAIEILVAEGRVRIDMPNAHKGARPIEAGAGNVIMTKADGTLVAMRSEQDIADRLSWRSGMLVFKQEPLGAAAAEFNRYNSKHIVVVGTARDLKIGGRFRADNVDVFTALIKEGFSLKIEDTGTEIIVSE